jgi:glycosyltransferase involved in cell wall biosynthesis
MSDRIPLLRVIARLNVGGPAIQAIALTRLLAPRGYDTLLVRGVEGPDEGSMDDLAAEMGVAPTRLRSLRRDPGVGDLLALLALVRILRRERPRILHTHPAKAGTLGRLAALLAFPRRRPVVVHTFHGHSLTGYFSSRTARFYLWVERFLARRTDRLIAVSAEVRDDLVRLGVAPSDRFEVVPVGLNLARFLDDEARAERRDRVRAQWGIPPGAPVVTIVARLVPIKRVDRFLAAARALGGDARFVVVGDGELRAALAGSEDAVALGERLTWAGFRRDMPDVCFASDVVVLTSDNEGTPVSLIEAQAAAVPVVSTAVGGVPSAVLAGVTGLLVAPDDEAGLAAAIAQLLADAELASRLATAGREHAARTFSVERLVDDLDALYRRLLTTDACGGTARA